MCLCGVHVCVFQEVLRYFSVLLALLQSFEVLSSSGFTFIGFVFSLGSRSLLLRLLRRSRSSESRPGLATRPGPKPGQTSSPFSLSLSGLEQFSLCLPSSVLALLGLLFRGGGGRVAAARAGGGLLLVAAAAVDVDQVVRDLPLPRRQGRLIVA